MTNIKIFNGVAEMNKKVLEGIKVVELSHVISGSYCGMLLGDLGADVIKIERPVVGEFYREEAIKNDKGVSLVYPNYNRNKKGMTINIKNNEGIELLKQLILKSDVFIENYRPGLLKSIGLGYEDLIKIKPDLIMVSISGFGQTGPYSMKPAYDMTISAISGFMSLNGPRNQPTKSGPAVSDFLSGIYGAFGAIAALRNRDLNGEGQYVDISMMECAMSILDAFYAQYKFTNIEPKSEGNRRANYAPVNVFNAKDGMVYIACSLEKHWEILTKLMGREDILNMEVYKNTKERKMKENEVELIVSNWTQNYNKHELIKILDDAGVPCALVQGIEDVMQDPQVIARNTIRTFDYPDIGDYPVVTFVPKFSSIDTPFERAPMLGEHNYDVLSKLLGYPDEKINAMKINGII